MKTNCFYKQMIESGYGFGEETCTNVADFDTQEEAVEWIKKPRIERNKERLVNPLLKKMREMYE